MEMILPFFWWTPSERSRQKVRRRGWCAGRNRHHVQPAAWSGLARHLADV